MPSKTEEYLALAQRTANGLTRYWESWTDYLTTASRLYKYSFADQLMIYAQRPDATACAEFDIWRNRMNRYVRRGSKGIALLDESSGFPRLHYVFDVSDTGVRRNSRDPERWEMNDDLFKPVSEMLTAEYGISHERLSQQLVNIAEKLVNDYWDNNSGDILNIVDGSFFDDYDSSGKELQFKAAATMSVTYTLLERCGFEPEGYFDKDDFQAIHTFSTPDAVYALGAATSDISREVLRKIERTVKTTTRRRNVERMEEYEQQSELHEDRGLPAPEPDPQPAEDPAGQVRQDAPELPEAVSPGTVQFDAPERDAVPASDGTGADGREPDAADDGRTAEAEPGPGQSAEPTDVGAAHEQSESAGRGTGDDGADLQLSFLDANIPTEAQQIEKIDRAESEKTPSAFSLSQSEIENELRRHGSGFAGGKQRIMALYQTQPDRKLRAKALAKEYGIGGHSHDFLDGSRGFVNHDWKGLEFDHYPDHQKITLKWAQVEKYIDLMIQSDRYLTDEEKEQRATRQEASNYNVGDEVVVDLPTRTIEGTIGYVGETDVRIDTSAHGQSWDNEVINKQQFEQGLRQSATAQRVDKMLAQAEAIAKESEVPEYERFSVRKVVDGKMPLFAIWDDLYDDYYETNHAVPQFSDEKQAESYLENLKREVADREAAEWLKVEHAKFLADKDEPEPSDEELDELPISAVMDGKVQTFPDAAALDKARNAEPAPEPAGNFHITDDHLGEGGAKQKYARNIEAICTLFKLEQEHRGTTAEEQQVLSQYVGWGGLSDAFDPGKDSWAKEYAELKGLLSEDEYAAARSSVLNAHYTSPTVIRGIYDAVERMGFRSGNILEPSMGVGNFFGMLPDTMADSRLYGVELDSITGRIAKMLYPQADITVAGFETTDRRDFYDLAVGNVPFGQYKVNDKAYNKLGFSIHNYFFAKAIDQVRPGGVVAFVTSRYTMDSKDSTARKHMAERADLLGAIRLPNNAFKANAGTEVVSDIIFLQKRDRPIDREPAWVQLGKTEDGLTLNSYFVDHPEMVLGELTTESTPYGHDLTVAPIEGAVLADQLAEAVQHIEGQYVEVEVETPDVADAEVERKTLPADPDVKNFSYAVVDGEVYYRENSIMTQVELSDNAKARVTGMVELRQIVNQLIQEQLDDYPDEDIKATQAKLNTAYDAFTAKYGLLNDRKNGRLFEDDSSYYLLCSLENLDENKQLKSKADMFTKRTIRPEHTVTSVDTPSEALAVSIGEHGRVDLPYMAELLGSPGDYERITTELQGVIFKDPSADADEPEAGWQTADEYLSGNVRNKLRMAQLAAESHPEFKINVEALTKAQPKDLEASEIDIRLGATWLNPAIVQQFMMETFQPPYRIRYNNLIQVRYSPFTSEWRIGNKSAAGMYDIMSTETYGTHRANAYKILEDTLNLRDCRIYDTIEEDGKGRRVLNQKETMLAQQKQQAIKDTFAGWVWQDPQRRNLLVKQYNELFNSTRPREYDGSHIHFVGMNPEINLREHQRNAVAHVLYGGNTLLAHEVGAGKSFEMAASAMESKRLGLCQKSLFVVPNHLTEQWASEFLRLYPNAKLLVTSKKDFEPANRKRFCARIATGDYDAVIIGHSQFEKIPLSAERQARIIEDQIEEIENAIAEAKEQSGEHFTVKQMEKTRKTLEVKLKKLQSTDRKDDVVTFEQLGVDRLFVDESQNYKNLYLYTKMRNVAGLSTSEAQKSSDMFGKCRYLDEVTGGRGVIFATGTPISNSMTEMYTLMRYLQYSTLQQKQLTHFDAWASTFGETTTAIELAPEGTGYRARTRFAKFFNLPELMNMFKEAADIKTSDQLHLPVPEAKFETVVVKPSEIQQDMVKSLSERAAEVHSGAVDPSVDNMLKITSDGRKIGLDQRLMNPLTPDDPDSKLNACVDNVLRIWNETKEDNLTQLIFCDMSTPKGDGSFNVYDDIRTKLLAAGVPESEVEFIHNADTEGKKADLFSKVRSGKVRVLLGSTAKMGAGTNVQTLLVAVHHLDVGWRPSDMTQRNGRIIRQGNKNKQVYVYNYVTEGTFDAYLWQTLENKQKFISQIMTSKSPMRSCDDVDEQALSYAEVKALCAGDPRIREKMDLDVQVAKLKVLRSDYQNQKYRLEDKLLKHYPEEIQKAKNRIAALKNDAQIADAHPQDKENFCGMTIKGMVFDEKKAAGERLMLACKEMPNADMMLLGTYRGFELNIHFDSFKNEHQIVLRGELSYPVPLGDDPRGNIVRLDNAIDNFADRIADAENALQNLEQQKQAAEVEVAKPFAQEEELAEKSARLAELDALLNMEHQSSRTEPEAEEKPDARPSVLAALEEKADKVEPVRPFKSYLDKDGDAR
ncbi:MAG: DEAD/DEAH box helicase family protein [Faecalibacterium prausnitzii]|uniref:DEAD/DEAH box helicase family protein n=1 Tax=Faecalibacterium prausnitzii TaxID=853 RepID=A0A9E1LYX1_9FIRM|nr:DEAD/DEAH box helicase family protein [Faecalibacterium prausnitzii]